MGQFEKGGQMKTQCPHCQKVISAPDNYKGKQIKCTFCRKVLVAEPIAGTAKLQASEQSTPSSSYRNRWIMVIIVSVALTWVIAFACGALLTKKNREDTKAAIDTIESEMQTYKAKNIQLRNELTQVKDELATMKANTRRLKPKLDSSDPLRPAGKQRVRSPKNISKKGWEIVDIDTKITERNNVFWQFAWRLTVKNDLA